MILFVKLLSKVPFQQGSTEQRQNLVNSQNKAGGAQHQRYSGGERVLEHQPREITELDISPPSLPPGPEKSHFIEFKSILKFY